MIFLILLLLFVIFVIGLFLVDYFRRTPNAKKIPLTFIVPCYNDADTVAETIDAIYAAYPLEFITLLVINDASSDNSHEVIVTKQNQYGFVYHQNLTNQGKVKTINNAIDQVQTEYFMIVDADTCVSGSAIDDMLGRLQHNKNVAAVSCYYKPLNRGFFPWMQGIEYHMLALIQGAYNIRSTISLWGGCIMMQTSACRSLSKFSVTAIVEDMDMAFRLNLHGYRVEQSHVGVYTHVPDTLRTWFKQKLRRNSGGMQCFIRYPQVWIKNPIHVVFTLLTNGILLFVAINVYKQILTLEAMLGFFLNLIDVMTLRQSLLTITYIYTERFFDALTNRMFYMSFSLPYIFPYMLQRKTWRRVLLIVPFVWLYIPLFSVMGLLGFIWGIYRHMTLRDGQRAR